MENNKEEQVKVAILGHADEGKIALLNNELLKSGKVIVFDEAKTFEIHRHFPIEAMLAATAYKVGKKRGSNFTPPKKKRKKK